ncbi:acid phosphatase [Caulobacter mirabilis]|uniref:Acid phosphatase n=1 Tax=Caulobacter mirabilis TaxID=69666 RepID=A0A2D2B2T6_9CAUL|nr:phosphatase PAP2 family protein [Caulobacter mirabilis]ATQ44526.1 acid phosphatase [Caulobacter mirabilis]
MRIILAGGVALGAALLVGVAAADTPWKGYLNGSPPDTTTVVPPPPEAGSIRAETDRAIFRQTRALKGTPRWDMAVQDVDERKIVHGMRCAIGVELDPTNAPKLTGLLTRVAPDVGRVTNIPKDKFQHKRPYLVDEGDICVEKTEKLAASPDYPSGHTTWGWTVGLLLAELAPDRAPQILQRARAFGESRVVCGVHNASAVEAGRTNAAALVAALHASPAFEADMAAARSELDRARQTLPKAANCDAEAALLAKPVW